MAPKPVPPKPPSSVGRLVSGSLDLGAFPPGAMLGERYRIIGLLGKGGMGEVYRADDIKLGQAVALKFLPKAVSGDESLLARFHAELRLARQVSHPNVCRIYDIGEIEGRHFLSMEYVDGEDLSSLLKRIGRLPVDKTVDIARQLCAGLHAAHERGVLWRVSRDGGAVPHWSAAGREIFFLCGPAFLAASVEEQGEDLRFGTPKVLFENQEITTFDAARDGKRFFVVESPNPGASSRLDVVLNWFSEVRRKVREAKAP
jgi:serine/threonine-protein kinase